MAGAGRAPRGSGGRQIASNPRSCGQLQTTVTIDVSGWDSPDIHRFSTDRPHAPPLTNLRTFLIRGTVLLPTGTAARADGETGNGRPGNQAGGVPGSRPRAGATRDEAEGKTSAVRENHGATRNRTDSWPRGAGPPTDLYERAGFRATEAPPSCYVGSIGVSGWATSTCWAVALAMISPPGLRKSTSTDMSCRVWATTRASISSGWARPILKN